MSTLHWKVVCLPFRLIKAACRLFESTVVIVTPPHPLPFRVPSPTLLPSPHRARRRRTMAGGGHCSRSGAAKGTATQGCPRSDSVEASLQQPILIDYSPFVCQSGRPCAGCLDYHERKRQAVEAAALKNRGTRSPVASNRFRSPLSVGSEDEDGEEEG